MELFEKTSKNKLRFETVRGTVSTEDLWDIPLKAKDNFDLDTIAISIEKKIKESEELTFVGATSSSSVNEFKLDILKHIIKIKIEENELKKEKFEKKKKEKKLLEILSRKKDQALENKSVEELEAELNNLKNV